MAKDLPYFKFFCSEWNDGDITLESFEAQGLFINVCSYYWSNECNVSFDKLNKKFRNYTELLSDLKKERLFKVDNNGFVSISFLDEQKEEREVTRLSRIKGGRASAEARRLKKEQESNTGSTQTQHVLNSSSTQTQLLRRDKIREEEIDNAPSVTPKASIDFEKLLGFINEKTKRTGNSKFKVVNKTVRNKYKARLKDGYTKDNIIQAVTNAVEDQYHKDVNYKYLTPEFFSRSEMIDKHGFKTKATKNNISLANWQG